MRACMARRRPGCIVSLASTHGVIGIANRSVYGISKAGVAHMTKMLAIEWAEHNITVNCIGPTFVATEYTRPRYDDPGRRAFIETHSPMRRWSEPDELAGAAVLLASEASSYMTGTTIYVDGGWLAH